MRNPIKFLDFVIFECVFNLALSTVRNLFWVSNSSFMEFWPRAPALFSWGKFMNSSWFWKVYPKVRFPNLVHVNRCFAEPNLKNQSDIYSKCIKINWLSAGPLQMTAAVINGALYGPTSNGFRYDARLYSLSRDALTEFLFWPPYKPPCIVKYHVRHYQKCNSFKLYLWNCKLPTAKEWVHFLLQFRQGCFVHLHQRKEAFRLWKSSLYDLRFNNCGSDLITELVIIAVEYLCGSITGGNDADNNSHNSIKPV